MNLWILIRPTKDFMRSSFIETTKTANNSLVIKSLYTNTIIFYNPRTRNLNKSWWITHDLSNQKYKCLMEVKL